MDITGTLHFDASVRILFYITLAIWLGIYGYIGYFVGDRKIKHVLLSMALAWFTSVMNTVPICIGLFLRRPMRFDVIEKERKIS
jgi:hypothetical protein